MEVHCHSVQNNYNMNLLRTPEQVVRRCVNESVSRDKHSIKFRVLVKVTESIRGSRGESDILEL